MPRKQIHIREADIELFERAEQLEGDNLSAVIADALRRLVDTKEAEAAGMQEVAPTVGIFHCMGDDNIRKLRELRAADWYDIRGKIGKGGYIELDE